MQPIIILLILLIGGIRSDSLRVTRVAQVTVGSHKNEVNVHRTQEGLYFAIDEHGQFWLVDAISRRIKCFNKKGELLYVIQPENPNARIDKIYLNGNYLFALSSESVLYLYEKYKGTLLDRTKLPVEKAYTNKAYFYDNVLFLPQPTRPAPAENLYEYSIEVRINPEQPIHLKVSQIRFFPKASFDPEKSSDNFLPIDSASIAILHGLSQTRFEGQSEDYILIMNLAGYERPIPEASCYLFLKREQILKKIGDLPETITGLVSQTWWGECSTIVDNEIYLMGVKYRNMKYHEDPSEIILSKIDLNDISKLPSIPIEEILGK